MRIEDSLFKYESILKTTGDKSIKPGETVQNHNQIKTSFADLLQQQIKKNELTFSKHAKERLEQRNINLTPADLENLNDAVKKAEEKGVANTLVLTGKGAFIINVNNNVVITAMSGEDMKENVFTQIDGAVII